MMTEYTYTLPINGNTLHYELINVFPDFEGIQGDSDNNVIVVFNNPLSATDKANLDNIMTTHDSTVKAFKIYEYYSNSKDISKFPGFINYKSDLDIRLHPSRTMVEGLLTNIIYYGVSSFDTEGEVVHSEPVINIDFTWDTDERGNILKRTSTIRYYYEDETLCEEEKQLEKLYNTIESFNATRRKRQNIIDEIEVHAYGLVLQTESSSTPEAIKELCSQWLSGQYENIRAYIETGSNQLLDAITSDTTYWMLNEFQPGVTIKEYIISKLS